ncbi:MAG: endo-1,4-beta-xylanase [Bacteroidales bacterium]|jgi:GH35 family endo-1,4-beta-xylanase|nr:endo-1,4-beta-xylanase [Bacteroidales bacterium]
MKKILNITALSLVFCFAFTGCYKEKMKWDSSGYGNVNPEDIPLPIAEKIERYAPLKTYKLVPNMKIGVGIDFSLYTNNETYRNLVNENFDDITAGNEMKQDALMTNSGALDFSKVDPVVDALIANGVTVFGHTLVWHNQQKAGYLNSLIAPEILPGPAGESLIDGDFEDGMGGWSPNFNEQDYAVVTTEALQGTHSLEATVGSGAAGKYDAQLTSPPFPVISGHHYEISIWIKCDGAGKIGLDFPNDNLGNQYPWVNDAELANVGTNWTEVKYNTESSGDPAMIATTDNPAMTFRLLLGAVADVKYYIDNVTVTDLDAAPLEVNLVENGDFETGEITPLTTPNPGAGITVSEEAKYEGLYGLKAIASATSANEWDLQFQTSEITVDPTKSYTVSFMIKSDIEGQGRISYSGFTDNYPWTDWDGSGTSSSFATSSIWKEISYTLPTDFSGDPVIKLSFDLGKLPDVIYYIDNVKIVEKSAEPTSVTRRKAPVVIEKTMEEKIEILTPVFENYITDVVTHFANKVAAWDVINEPMNENGTVRTGEENLTSASTFYWQYYLGQDYAVTAFKKAKAANPDAKLFINDYNLESASPAKVDGLIEYVSYIESKGAVVDGIGTQMHLNLEWTDTISVANMFQKLANTGKLIKISELDIAFENNPESPVSPTAANLERQAMLYELVVKMYNQYIPESQRYGITVWGVSDNENEHQYWLKNDAPCLWDADYNRKWAYKGFCDGLAGRDVSVDFPGTLE